MEPIPLPKVLSCRFTPTPKFLGMDADWSAPGWDFILEARIRVYEQERRKRMASQKLQLLVPLPNSERVNEP
jgi:hypothetical protein